MLTIGDLSKATGVKVPTIRYYEEIGLIAPPVGLNVYVISGIERETPIGETYRGVVPFLISDLVRTTLLLLFPVLSLYLVRVMD